MGDEKEEAVACCNWKMRALRYLIPALPLYIWALPILLFVLIPWVGLYLNIALVYAFYPYLSAWNGSAPSGDELQKGIAFTTLHWLVVLGLHFRLTRKLTDQKAIAWGLVTIFISGIAANLLLAVFGYHVSFHFDL